MGLDDQRVDQVRAEERATPHPLLSGAHGGPTLALQQLARDGVVLVGRLLDITGCVIQFGEDLFENMRFGDDTAASFRRSVDEHIDRKVQSCPMSSRRRDATNHRTGPRNSRTLAVPGIQKENHHD
jgi:putative flavoprotein involved in K+ transport